MILFLLFSFLSSLLQPPSVPAAPPMAPPMAPPPPLAPSLSGPVAPKLSPVSVSTSTPKPKPTVSPSDDLLAAIRGGAKLRKVGTLPSPSSGTGGGVSGTSSGGIGKSATLGAPVNMMAQLANALAGRRNHLADGPTTSSSSGPPVKKFNIPKANVGAPEPVKEVVWD